MAGILLGDEGCLYKEIVDIFTKNDSINHHLSEWSLMAFDLSINQIDNKLIQKRNQTPQQSIYDVLVLWRSTNAENSTLGNFLNCLPRDWNQLKEYVRDLIWEKAQTWNDLDDVLQDRLRQSKVRFLGTEYTLSSLGYIPDDTMMKQDLPQKPFQNIFQCDEFEFPLPLKYYINRKLTVKKKLKPEIFTQKCDDIFVFENIERYELSNLEKCKTNEPTNDSRDWLRMRNFSVRFIKLSNENDFSEITRKTEHPVHRIKYNKIEKSFHWVCTVGSINLITKFLSDCCEEIPESNFLKNNLMVFNTRPVAICSSPGMGKSFLLKHLANQMKETFPDRFVIFLGLQNLIDSFKVAQSPINKNFVIDKLCQESTSNKFGNAIMKHLMHNETNHFEIFLDGFDEIPSTSLSLARQMLGILIKTSNIRCYITSRPHMTMELEQTIGVVSHDIAPFTSEDQIKFFFEYWSGNLNTSNQEAISQFASELLESSTLEHCGQIKYTEIAGIPLQCYMLAEVHSEDVINFCSNQNDDFEILIDTTTVFELYRKYMAHKFQHLGEIGTELVKRFHWLYALDILFPENPEALIIRQCLETELEKTPVSNEMIFKVGILETRENLSNPEFGHRTFAEFLLAEFIAKQFLTEKTHLKYTWTTFVFDTILDIQRIHENTQSDYQLYEDILKYSSFWGKSYEISEVDLKKLETELLELSVELQKLQHAKQRSWPKGSKDDYFYHSERSLLQVDNMVYEFDNLVCALYKLKWLQIADELERAAAYHPQKCKISHATICYFLDGILKDCQNVKTNLKETQISTHRGLFSQLNGFSKTFIKNLLAFTGAGFENLTPLVLKLGIEVLESRNNLQIDYKGCQELVFIAARHNNLRFFTYCNNIAKQLSGDESLELKINEYINTPDFMMKYVYTPLHVAVSRGNYNICEYVVLQNQIDQSTKHGLWQICLHGSYKDSDYTIQQKIQILGLLESKDLITKFDTMIDREFPHKVHSKLFTEFCDILNYIPSESDLSTIDMHVILYSDENGKQMSSFVDWMHERNIFHLLIHSFHGDSSLLKTALRYKKITPQTLIKIYGLEPFDISKMLWSATQSNTCEIMIETIVELTGQVNQVDSTHYNQRLLHLAVIEQSLNAVKFLLSKGAEVNIIDDFGNTPLHYALLQRYPVLDIVKLLLQNGSDVNLKNKKAESPLFLSKKIKTNDLKDCLSNMFLEFECA